ncbi:cytochrome C [Thioclava sp. GXIMD4216]|uniref:Cytochrome C n=1 Tax=Thioclava litoralis TaxID=3076557 RepID=A0ABZ1DYM5_9RHOB|nr:cytochrome C [Thioclava sp. FTW29]
MKISLFATLTAVTLAAPAFAQDAAKGEKEFRACKACHAIVAPDGTAIVKGGKVGPNLYGVIGRQVGSLEGFKYKDSIKAVGATGAVWTKEELEAYITDPNAWLEEKTGDKAARSGMTFKAKKGQGDIAAYLESVAK